ncbi:uncharacterized protein [Amphiura filiformis]|uniref:uncharacterized protein n=1 Tax=Amphiura filiformis TaxID=82378 RepID=UPI003B212AE5
MEDIDMNRQKATESQENKNNHGPNHATFEDLWSSVLDDSPPSSQVSSPVHNNQHHVHNQNHQRRKKRFKIRVPCDSTSSSAKLNEVEQALVNQAIRDSLSRVKRSRGSSRVHQTNLTNTQNNAYTLGLLPGAGKGNVAPNTAGTSATSPKSIQSVGKTQPACTQSRPETVTPSQDQLSAPKQASSPATSVQKLPNGAQLPAVNVTAQQSIPTSHSTSNDIPQMPNPRSPHSPEKSPSSVPSASLPPGFNYMSESQKQLFYEYQKQQQIRKNKQQVIPSVSQPIPSNMQQQAPNIQQRIPAHQNGNQKPRSAHSQGVSSPQSRHHQQNLENLQHSQGGSLRSSNQELQQNLQQLPSSHDVPLQNVQRPSPHQTGTVSGHQQQSQVSYSQVQQQHQQNNQQQQQQNNQQTLQHPREQSLQPQVSQPQVSQPQVSQPQSTSSVSASVVEKRKSENQREEHVEPKKPRNEDVQPPDEPAEEVEPPPGPTQYQVGGENNMVVHAPKGCTFNIYQNRSQHSDGGHGHVDRGDGGGDCNGNCGGNQSRRMNQKQHAIEWATGGTNETDSGSHPDRTATSVPTAMFRDMSKSIGRKWKFLARQLPMVEYGLLESELKELDACSGNDMDKSLAVLTKWWKENPDSWDAEKMKRQLEDALRECHLVRLARNIDETFQALTVSSSY